MQVTNSIAEKPVPDFDRRFVNFLREGLKKLSDHPLQLWLILLTLNCLFLPYQDRTHDAILYRAQAENTIENGKFQSDLFFRYGSQDNYSIFSMVVAPVAKTIGISAVFFLMYLVSNGIFYWNLIGLIERLTPERHLSTLALITLSISSPLLGGMGVFYLNESFFTPRVLSLALAIAALNMALTQRTLLAFSLAMASTLVHPLMGISGFLLLSAWCILQYCPTRIAISIFASSAMILLSMPLFPDLWYPILGYMDPEWLREVCVANPYAVPSEWNSGDYINAVAPLAIFLCSYFFLPTSQQNKNLILGLVLVFFLSLFLSLISLVTPFAIIIKGQPYRFLWIGQLLAYPLGIFLFWHWYGKGMLQNLLSFLLFSYLFLFSLIQPFFLLMGFSAVLVLTVAGHFRPSLNKDIIWPTGYVTLMCFTFAQTILAWILLVQDQEFFLEHCNFPSYALVFVAVTPLFLKIGIATFIAFGIRHLFITNTTLTATALTMTILAISFFTGVLPHFDWFRRDNDPNYETTQLVRSVVQERDSSRTPRVYWQGGMVDTIWFDLGATSYYTRVQLSGNMFSRETAIEGRRRANLAAPFEVDSFRENKYPSALDHYIKKHMYAPTALQSPPSIDAFVELVKEKEIDFIVVKLAIPKLYVATDGTYYVYDCNEIRRQGLNDALTLRTDNKDNTGAIR